MKKIRLMTVSRCALERCGVSGETIPEEETAFDEDGIGATRCCIEAYVFKSAGDEKDRFGGVDSDGLGGGGSKKDFADHVLTRWRVDEDAESAWISADAEPEPVGVDGGVFGDANTSSWRDK